MRILIVLVPGFSMLSLGAIIEPFRVVNSISPEFEIDVKIATISDLEVKSASDAVINCPLSFQACLKLLTDSRRPEALFLCCGLRTPYKAQRDLQKLIRATVRAGIPLYGTGCAAWKMADTGILSEGRGTVHWTTLAAFAERHRRIKAEDALFVTSNLATSTPGEAATLDMVVSFIQMQFSDVLAREVCDHLMISFPRRGDLNQPRGRGAHLQNVPDKLHQILSLMDQNLETPLRIRDIAQQVGTSMRQVERLFAKHLSVSPKQYYIKLRLWQGQLLIEQTSMSILETSIAVGFSSRREFTRFYRNEFGYSPAHTRRNP